MNALVREVAGIALATLGLVGVEVGALLLHGWSALLLVNGLLALVLGVVLMRHDRDHSSDDG